MDNDDLSEFLYERMGERGIGIDYLVGYTGLPESMVREIMDHPEDVPLDRLVNVTSAIGLKLNLEFVPIEDEK